MSNLDRTKFSKSRRNKNDRNGVKLYLSSYHLNKKVSFYEYIQDHILKKNAIPPLPVLIQQAARELNLGRSWSLANP